MIIFMFVVWIIIRTEQNIVRLRNFHERDVINNYSQISMIGSNLDLSYLNHKKDIHSLINKVRSVRDIHSGFTKKSHNSIKVGTAVDDIRTNLSPPLGQSGVKSGNSTFRTFLGISGIITFDLYDAQHPTFKVNLTLHINNSTETTPKIKNDKNPDDEVFYNRSHYVPFSLRLYPRAEVSLNISNDSIFIFDFLIIGKVDTYINGEIINQTTWISSQKLSLSHNIRIFISRGHVSNEFFKVLDVFSLGVHGSRDGSHLSNRIIHGGKNIDNLSFRTICIVLTGVQVNGWRYDKQEERIVYKCQPSLNAVDSSYEDRSIEENKRNTLTFLRVSFALLLLLLVIALAFCRYIICRIEKSEPTGCSLNNLYLQGSNKNSLGPNTFRYEMGSSGVGEKSMMDIANAPFNTSSTSKLKGGVSTEDQTKLYMESGSMVPAAQNPWDLKSELRPRVSSTDNNEFELFCRIDIAKRKSYPIIRINDCKLSSILFTNTIQSRNSRHSKATTPASKYEQPSKVNNSNRLTYHNKTNALVGKRKSLIPYKLLDQAHSTYLSIRHSLPNKRGSLLYKGLRCGRTQDAAQTNFCIKYIPKGKSFHSNHQDGGSEYGLSFNGSSPDLVASIHHLQKHIKFFNDTTRRMSHSLPFLSFDNY